MNIPAFPKILLHSCGLALFCHSVACAQAPPVAVDYWPMKAGNSWTVESTGNGKATALVLTVVKSVRREGPAIEATIEYAANGTVVQTEVYRTDAHGITRLHGGKGGADTPVPPFPVIKYPLIFGSTWTWQGTITTGGKTFQGTADFKVSGPVALDTLAGHFQTARIQVDLVVIDSSGAKAAFTNDYWFAPGVGMVQQQFMLGETKLYSGAITSYQLQK